MVYFTECIVLQLEKKVNAKKVLPYSLAIVLALCFPVFALSASQKATIFGVFAGITIQAFLFFLSLSLVLLAVKKRGKYTVALVVLVIGSLLVSVPVFSSSNSILPERYVGAYYYIWYDGPCDWGYGHPDRPNLGEYASSDIGVIDQHLTWASQSGIDYLVISLWSDLAGSDYFSNAQLVFERNKALGNPVKLCTIIEPRNQEEVTELTSKTYQLYSEYDSYFCWNGKPLMLFYNQYMSYTDSFYDNRFTTRMIPLEAPYFIEGVQTYLITDIVSVAPGINISSSYVPRNDGSFYSSQWDIAIVLGRVNPHRDLTVLITSFNEWPEDTAIEPANNWGTRYLELTAYYSSIFKRIW